MTYLAQWLGATAGSGYGEQKGAVDPLFELARRVVRYGQVVETKRVQAVHLLSREPTNLPANLKLLLL